MAPRCQRCRTVAAAYVVTMHDEKTAPDPLDLCAGCAAGAMNRGYVKSLVDGLAVWKSP